jgi:6-phosphogluconolactonase
MDTFQFCFLNFVAQIIVPESKAALSEAVLANFSSILEKLKDSNAIHIAISGGSLPSLFAEGVLKSSSIDWKRIHFWFADERYVDLNDNDSNYKECQAKLFSRIPTLPAENIHPINPALSLQECAADYQKQINAALPSVNSFPQFDLILLGMGPDGHTASLFPHHKLLSENKDVIAYLEDSPKPPPKRITLTLPVINNARFITIIATGDSKKEVLGQIFNKENYDKSLYPISLVQNPNIVWLVDQDAVKLVSKSNL